MTTKPFVKILYNTRDISADVSDSLNSFQYNDRSKADPDEVSITLADPKGLWIDEWYPDKSARLDIEFGYEGNTVRVGPFQVDEIEFSSSPDMVTIKGLATGITKSFRTKNNKAYDSQTLADIALAVAKKLGLTLLDSSVGSKTYSNSAQEVTKLSALSSQANGISSNVNDTRVFYGYSITILDKLVPVLKAKGFTTESDSIASIAKRRREFYASVLSSQDYLLFFNDIKLMPNELAPIIASLKKLSGKTITKKSVLSKISFRRVNQYQETDLAFLNRLGKDYGFLFSVRGDNLIFVSKYVIEAAEAVLEIDKTDCSYISLRDKTSETFTSARVISHNPVKRDVMKYSIQQKVNQDGVAYTIPVTGDELVVRTKTESVAQAEAKAKAAIHFANSRQQSGSINVPGNPLLVAGNNFDFTGMGKLSGKYNIEESSHTINVNGGYLTGITIKRVGFITKERAKPKKKRKTNYVYKVTK